MPELWIKICGMRALEDIEAAVAAGVDALGFVFYEPSPRHLALEAAQALQSVVPAHVERVAVFLHPSQARVDAVIDALRVGLQVAEVSQASLVAVGPALLISLLVCIVASAVGVALLAPLYAPPGGPRGAYRSARGRRSCARSRRAGTADRRRRRATNSSCVGHTFRALRRIDLR